MHLGVLGIGRILEKDPRVKALETGVFEPEKAPELRVSGPGRVLELEKLAMPGKAHDPGTFGPGMALEPGVAGCEKVLGNAGVAMVPA